VVVGVALAAGIGAGLWWLAERAGEQDTPSLGGLGEAGNSTEVSPQDPLSGAAPAAPADLVGVVTDGQAVFTWSNPSAADGDSYRWRRISELGDAASEMTLATLPTVSLPIEGDEPVCIEVVTVRANGTGSVGSAKGCAK
jgi:hypothetical protein